MKTIYLLLVCFFSLTLGAGASHAAETNVFSQNGITSIDTKHNTIMKVRTAKKGEDEIIIGSDYYGNIVACTYSGSILWKAKTGEGTMNHDIWCGDLAGDDKDEILAANANGIIYCFDIDGKELWHFSPYSGYQLTPMYAVCIVKDKSQTPYVVCGDFSCNIYYLNSSGQLEKKIHSSKYSKVKGWGSNKPDDYSSVSNFLRPIPQKNGSDLLLINTTDNHMQSSGHICIMEPLSEIPLLYISDFGKGPTGDIRIFDRDGDGIYEVLVGSSTLNNHTIEKISFNSDYTSYDVVSHVISSKNTGKSAYRVNQPFVIENTSSDEYSFLSSTKILTYKVGDEFTLEENLTGMYTFNDICTGKSGKVILASSQDGGSCIHIIDTNNSNWKSAFQKLSPIGKIARMKSSAVKIRKELESFEKPAWQRDPVKVTGFEGNTLPIASELKNSKSLELFASPWNRGHCQIPTWRDNLYVGNDYYSKRDRRNKYDWTSDQLVDFFTGQFDGVRGIQMWGGHGNDPLYYSLDVLEKIADYGYENGEKRTVYVYPEMNQYGPDFDFMMENQIYPLIKHLDKINGKVAFRSKDIFWQGHVYTSSWDSIRSGKYAGTVIPMLEETTDKTQDLSILGRLGLWTSGAVDGWGVRCSRDDPSFDRERQFSSQKLSNHFLRKIIFSVACGANYLHNSYPDVENPEEFKYHTSLALELIQKQALFVPKRNEIVSFNPVHLAITNPSERYLNEGSNNKWISYFNKSDEDSNPMVFSHMNGSWLGGTVTPWDFSYYANGVIDRRQNVIAPYPYGQVLITPVQQDCKYKDNESGITRGNLIDHINPIYKNITKEYITDGQYYYSKGGIKYNADTYYEKIKSDIEAGAKEIPINVTANGQVGWVVAQVSGKHLRLTLVDGSWLAPDDKIAKVTFNTVSPVKVKDILDNTVYPVENGKTSIDVPCGMFRFIDIELEEELNVNNSTGSSNIKDISCSCGNPSNVTAFYSKGAEKIYIKSDRKIKYTLYDIDGVALLSKYVNKGTSINMDGKSRGVYILSIVDNKENITIPILVC